MPESSININFSKGLNTKTDPWQLPIGQFLSLRNMVFQVGGLLEKRNGYGLLAGDTPTSSYLTTLNDNLLAVGDTISAYSPSTQNWVTKGNLQPCSVSTMPVIRNNYNQTQCDSATGNGFICVVFSESDGVSSEYFYAIENAATGQNIVPQTQIPTLAGGTNSGSSRVFIVGNFFVIVSQVLVTGTHFLQYVSIPLNHPTSISPAQNTYPEAYVPISGNPGWDGVVVDDTLVLAYNTTAGGQAVHVVSILASQIAANTSATFFHSFTGSIAAVLSMTADFTVSPIQIYISFWSASTAYTASVYISFGAITTLFAPTAIATGTITNIASSAQNGSALVYTEFENNYSYDAAIPTHYIQAVSVSLAGAVGTPYILIRSVGLASQGFIVEGTDYILTAFQSPYQPTYFLINASLSTEDNPVIVAKLAYQNGGGYVTLGLPSVTLDGTFAQIPYLFKQSVQALNTTNTPQQTSTGGIYSQLGINQVTFELGTEEISSAEIAQTLNFSGGFLGLFDGYYPVEQNFFVFPDSVEATWSATGGSIVAKPDGTTNADAYFYQATYEWTDMQGNPYRSTPSISIPVTTTGSASTGSITVNVPYLRLTQKIASPVKIVIYRWSVHTQVYNQVTSIFQPVINDTTTDSIAYVDTLADASIVGNNLIYTTGGVIPDVNGPSTNLVTLFDTRLWLVSAEDPNTLFVSKTVVQGSPVEMCSAFTIYVAPNIGTVSTSGPITAIFPMDDKLVCFKQNSIFYINGTGPNDLGTTSAGCPLGNYSPPTFITSVVGCTNQKSIVLTQDGLMFQSDKGIWILSRSLQTTYIGAPVEAFNSSLVNSANVIPDTNYVLFTLDTGEMLMYDYYYQQWGTFVNVPAISSCIYQGSHTVLNPFNQILQETPGVYLDNTAPVVMQFTTSWINLASLQGYERFYEFYLLGKYLSPHFLLVQVAYNYNPSISHQSTIAPQNFSPSTPSPFGSPTPLGSPGNLEQWRIHAKQQLCQSFQLSIQEVFNPLLGTEPGAGFTLSGLNCKVLIKKARRPIAGSNAVG